MRPAQRSQLQGLADRAAGQSSSENFPVALRVLPAVPRARLGSLYRYARFVDDIGDEADGGAPRRLELLEAVEADVNELWGGRAELPPVLGLADLVQHCQVGPQPFLDLIEANRLDQRESSYPNFDDLLGYCRLSAAPIGNVVLHIAAAATATNVRDSDTICAALQVLEHCQDVREDALAGRIYLPAAELTAAGVPAADLRAAATSTALRGVIATQVERAEQMLRAGAPLVARLSGWSRIAVAGYLAGGVATAHALRAHDFDVLAVAVRPSRLRTAAYAARAWGTRSGTRWGR